MCVVSDSLLPCCFHSCLPSPWEILFFLFGYQSTVSRVGPRRLCGTICSSWSRNRLCFSLSLGPQLRSVSDSVLIIFHLNQLDGFCGQVSLFSFPTFSGHPLPFVSPYFPIYWQPVFLFSYLLFLLGHWFSYCAGFVRRCLDRGG